MQIQYNITRIEEWCKSHDMQEGTLQLESLMQATKLLQLKKVRRSVITEFMLSRTYYPTRIGNPSRHRYSLRRLLDFVTHADPEADQPVSRCRLRGGNDYVPWYTWR